MSTIIAGQFDTFDEATRASELLSEAAFAPDSVAVFFSNAPGAHDTYPLGGDENADPGARNAHLAAAAGAAVGAAAGLAATLVASPLVLAAAATTGAYVGSLAGGVNGGAVPSHDPARRSAGVFVAVALPEPASEDAAVMALRHGGARNIERAQGEIQDRRWLDFDPVEQPQILFPRAASTRPKFPGD